MPTRNGTKRLCRSAGSSSFRTLRRTLPARNAKRTEITHPGTSIAQPMAPPASAAPARSHRPTWSNRSFVFLPQPVVDGDEVEPERHHEEDERKPALGLPLEDEGADEDVVDPEGREVQPVPRRVVGGQGYAPCARARRRSRARRAPRHGRSARRRARRRPRCAPASPRGWQAPAGRGGRRRRPTRRPRTTASGCAAGRRAT